MNAKLEPTQSVFRVAYADLARSQRADVARLAKCSEGHLRNVSYGLRPLTPAICAAIERVTAAKHCVETLLPDERWMRVPDKKYPHPNGRPVVDPIGKLAKWSP